MPNHIMCIGWPTIKRLAAGESVWFEDLQCGAVAADDLHGADIDGMIAARIGEYDERIWMERVGKAEAEVEKLREQLGKTQEALRDLLDANHGVRNAPSNGALKTALQYQGHCQRLAKAALSDEEGK